MNNPGWIHYDRSIAEDKLIDYVNRSAAAINTRVYLDPDIHFQVAKYQSSVDDTGPLYTNVLFKKSLSGPLPVMIYLHGYSSNRSREMYEQVRAAEKGFFVISPDMRGRGTACPTSPYCDYPPTPYPLLLLEAETDIFFSRKGVPSELAFVFDQSAIKSAVVQRAREVFDARIKSGDLNLLEDVENYSAGEPDDGAMEIHDIYDAVVNCHEEFDGQLDMNNIHAMGLSGGGGSVFSTVTKFPEFLNTAASFYGIADYGYWYYYSNPTNRAGFQEMMRQNIGGTPDDRPERYMARNSLLGAGNNPHTDIHLYWDETERQCPNYFNLKFHHNAVVHGLNNVSLHETLVTEPGRALHVYPLGEPTRMCLEQYLDMALVKGTREPRPVENPRYSVLGYLRTRDLFILFNNGRDCVVDLEVENKNEGLRLNMKSVVHSQGSRGFLQLLNRFDGLLPYVNGKACSKVTRGNNVFFEIPLEGTVDVY